MSSSAVRRLLTTQCPKLAGRSSVHTSALRSDAHYEHAEHSELWSPRAATLLKHQQSGDVDSCTPLRNDEVALPDMGVRRTCSGLAHTMQR